MTSRSSSSSLFVTGRYQDYRPRQGAPVRTTVGHPRGWASTSLAGHLLAITPLPNWLALKGKDFIDPYRERLDGYGVDVIRAAGQEILANAEARGWKGPLVLMCFCDLAAPGALCHRRVFAVWWTELTGEEIIDLQHPPTLDGMSFGGGVG